MQLDDDDLARRLDAMPEVEPPFGFRQQVMRQVERRPSPAAGVARGSATLHRRYTFAALWAAAAVLVFGFFILGHQRMNDTTATMAPPSLVVTRDGDLFTIEAVTPARPQTVSIAIDRSTVDLVGVLDKKDASFRKTTVEFTLRGPTDRAGIIVRPRAGVTSTAVGVSVGRMEVTRRVVALE